MSKNEEKNAVQKTIELMNELRVKKSEDIACAIDGLNGAKMERDSAVDEMDRTAADMDIDAYEEAHRRKVKADNVVSMYERKLQQIHKQEYISEAESDTIIDSLLSYEVDLDADFSVKVSDMLVDLNNLYANYINNISVTEHCIEEWTAEIHPNYSTRGRTTYAETGTDRSPVPVPVRAGGRYKGNDLSRRVYDFLQQNRGEF